MKVIVNLEKFEQDTDRAVAVMYGRQTPEELLYSDIKETYLKYLWKYATEDIIVVTNKVEEQVYLFQMNRVKIVPPSKLTEMLAHKAIVEVVVDKSIDQTKITYQDDDTVRWISVLSKDAEAVGLKEKTKRIHKKPQSKIDKENRILLLLQLLPILLPIPLIIYSYNTENVAGLGVMTGVTLAFLLRLILDRKYTNPYEKRI